MSQKKRNHRYPKAELGTLAAALKDPSLLPRVLSEAPAEAYADPDLQVVRRELGVLLEGGDQYDLAGRFQLLSRRLPQHPGVRRALEALWAETGKVSSATFDADLQALAEASMSRALIGRLEDILERHRQGVLPARQAALELIRRLSDVAVKGESIRISNTARWLAVARDAYYAAAKAAKEGRTLYWQIDGFSEFSADVEMKPGRLLLLAAQTGVGKTWIALHWALYLAVLADEPIPVLYLNSEMPEEDVAQRALAVLAGVPLGDVQKGARVDEVGPKLDEAVRKFEDGQLHLSDDIWNLDLAHLEALIVQYKAEHGVRLVIVDYLQNLWEVRSRGDAYRWETLMQVSSQLKQLAQRYEVGIIATAQLNKAGDLQGSKAIANDCDAVFSLWDVRDRQRLQQRAPREWLPVLLQCHEAGASHALCPEKNRNGRHRVFAVRLFTDSPALEVEVIDPAERRNLGNGQTTDAGTMSVDELLAGLPLF